MEKMNNKKMKWIWIISLIIVFMSNDLSAQEKVTVEGRVYNSLTRLPLTNIQVSSPQSTKSIMTDANGYFKIKLLSLKAVIIFKGYGFVAKETFLNNRKSINIYLMPDKQYMEGGAYKLNGVEKSLNEISGNIKTINKRDLITGYNTPDEALLGKFTGLRSLSKSGISGEGAALFMRGIRSLVSTNSPLIVIDGLPYLPSMDVSRVVEGFSKNVFTPVNTKEIKRISLLKGADASLYGSLGANGVIIIETEGATDRETKLQFHTVEGISFVNKRLPLLNAKESKSYLADIGENKYSNPETLIKKLPFLEDDPKNPTNYLYNHDTDWQDEIYEPAFTSENTLQVKGGDAVATYMLSLGTQQNKGVVKNTNLSKYYTRLNADIVFSRRLKASMGASLNYTNYKLHEQGMAAKTSPLLTALYQAPFMSVYKQAYQMDGTVKNVPFFNPVHPELKASNPAAVVEEVKGQSSSYDIMINMGFSYDILSYLSAKGVFGLFYNNRKDDLFVPGKNFHAIAALRDSLAINTVRASISEQLNYYGNLYLTLDKTWDDIHTLNASAGVQFMTSSREFDMGEGANTPTDFYTLLNNVSVGRKVDGYIDDWTWMNIRLNGDYRFAREFYVGAGVSIDASSSYGQNSGRWFVFPYIKGAWKLKENVMFNDVQWLSDLRLRGEFGINGNSRFSSKFGKYYYEGINYRSTSGITRNGLPNTLLKPERVINSALGMDFALLGNRLKFSIDVFNERTKDMIVTNIQPALYGFDYRYENVGEINTKGLEANIQMNIINHKDYNWVVGANISTMKSEVKSLGNIDERIINIGDGAKTLLRKGESPYLFYGKKMEKVFYTTDEAISYGYKNTAGKYFVAGDIKFEDVNGDKYINDEDNVIIGDPSPDFYGSLYTTFSYKNWSLFANFTYSYGNDIYNAVRRSLSSMKNFSNQDHSVARRWMIEGQITDIPRASYGDPSGNSRFSSRWIEDGSYIKLKELVLSYELTDKKWIFNNMRFYVLAENLITFTKYLGMDPEFSYSYSPELIGVDLGKMPLAKSVKLGVILNF